MPHQGKAGEGKKKKPEKKKSKGSRKSPTKDNLQLSVD